MIIVGWSTGATEGGRRMYVQTSPGVGRADILPPGAEPKEGVAAWWVG